MSNTVGICIFGIRYTVIWKSSERRLRDIERKVACGIFLIYVKIFHHNEKLLKVKLCDSELEHKIAQIPFRSKPNKQ